MYKYLSRWSWNDRAIPLVLSSAAVASFGLLLPWLGFYWDDWPVIYLTETQGIGGFREFYQYDRPFSAWTYILFAPLLGTTPALWQGFTLLVRCLTAILIWASLKELWPGRPHQVFWTSLLFAVAPIFTLQPVAVAYSQHWLCYLLYFCSIYLMLRGMRSSRHGHLFTGLAALTSLLQMLTMEYFLGLEVLRPVILWHYYRQREPAAPTGYVVRRVAASGWIYLGLLIVYVIWRMFFLRLAGADPNRPVLLADLLGMPLQALLDLAQKAIQDSLYIVTAWPVAVRPADIDLSRVFSLAALAAAILAAVLFRTVMGRYRPVQDETQGDRWPLRAMSLGWLAILLGMLPVWLIDRQASTGSLGARFSLAAMFGVSLLWVSFLDWLSPKKNAKITVICLLMGIAVYANLNTAKAYQQSWEKQRAFYWQLFWRAPYMQPGTALISNGEIFPYVGLYSTSMAINLLYPPADDPHRMPYWFFSYWERLYKSPDEILEGAVLDSGLRNHVFLGNTRDAIVLDFSPEQNRCLQLISSRDSSDPDLPVAVRELSAISALARIEREPPQDWRPPRTIFGREPAHSWCYYFEKAELAYQHDDWEEVIRLMDTAKKQGFAPGEMKEFLPLLQAYLRTGRIEPARTLSLQMARLSNNIDDRICSLWLDELQTKPDPALESAFENVREKSRCFD